VVRATGGTLLMIGIPLRCGLKWDVDRNRSGYMGFTTGKAKTAGKFFLKRYGVNCRRWNLRTYLNLVSGFCRREGNDERNISGYMDPTVGKAKTANVELQKWF